MAAASDREHDARRRACSRHGASFRRRTEWTRAEPARDAVRCGSRATSVIVEALLHISGGVPPVASRWKEERRGRSRASPLAELAVRRPQRADARRNFDALLAAAREAFAEHGTEASLEDIARRAGVGIGTLYRNFPTRQDLFETVYIGEVEELCQAADDARRPAAVGGAGRRGCAASSATPPPSGRMLRGAQPRLGDVPRAAARRCTRAGEPLLARAQDAGEVRTDLTFDDLLRMVSGLTAGRFADDAQRERVLGIALDGIRAGR